MEGVFVGDSSSSSSSSSYSSTHIPSMEGCPRETILYLPVGNYLCGVCACVTIGVLVSQRTQEEEMAGGFDSVLPGRICEGCGVWRYDWCFDSDSTPCHECEKKKAKPVKLADRVQALEQELEQLRSLFQSHLEDYHEDL